MDSRLNTFFVCAKQLSFTRAAKILNMTQPAVTFQIKNLEDEYKANLFVRDGNQLKLTYPGKILFKHADKILTQYEDAKNEIFQATSSLTGEIRVGIASVLSKYLLPKMIGYFKQKYQDVDIYMFVGNSGNLIEELKQYSLDMAVVSEPVRYKRFVIKPFINDELVVIVNSQHKWVERKQVTIEELTKEPFVDRENGSGTREMYKKYFSDNGFSLNKFNVIMRMGSVEAVKSYVESGTCYGIVSSIAVKRELDAGIIKQVKIQGESMERKFLVIYPSKTYNKMLIRIFLDEILAKAKQPL